MEKAHLYIGKGGVGKSTCSSLGAVKATQKGQTVLLDSLDPAHNLHDIFGFNFNNKPKKINEKLYIRESDIKSLSKLYLKSVQNQLKGLYHYQQALNIDRYFSILKYAPGTEEYASLLALERCFDEKKFDEVFIDTPPTALTLKTIALPCVNLHWINSLVSMREEIVKKKNTVANIRKENLDIIEEDPVFMQLMKMKKRYENLNTKLSDDNLTEFVLILNEDELSFSESKLIKREMNELGFKIHRLIINKSSIKGESFVKQIEAEFPSSIIEKLPLSSDQVISLETLEEFSKKIEEVKKA